MPAAQKIPQKFLELILAGLKQAGFVESRRGAEGGYLLARAAESLTVGEVLRSIEGTGQGRSRSRRKTETPFTDMWRQVDCAVSGVIDKTTFAELLRGWTDKAEQVRPQLGDLSCESTTTIPSVLAALRWFG